MAGDSGGPVMALYDTSAGQVRAAGMIQALGPAALELRAVIHSRACSTNVYFTSMRTIVNSISGGSLLTGP